MGSSVANTRHEQENNQTNATSTDNFLERINTINAKAGLGATREASEVLVETGEEQIAARLRVPLVALGEIHRWTPALVNGHSLTASAPPFANWLRNKNER